MRGMTGKNHSDEAKAKMRAAKLGKRTSPATEFKKGQPNPYELKRVQTLPRGEANGNWAGDNVGYGALHSWVARRLGKPRECSECSFTSDNGRQFHWANISGEYRRDLTDWIRLCAKCHYRMDNIIERAWLTRKAGV